MDRDSQLIALRPHLPLETEYALAEEKFQNQTLRPILKLQHELLLTLFRNYLEDKCINFESMNAFKQRLAIENAIKKDLPIRHTLIGCIIGHFTKEEYELFLANRLAHNKRLTTLIIQRLTDALVVSRE